MKEPLLLSANLFLVLFLYSSSPSVTTAGPQAGRCLPQPQEWILKRAADANVIIAQSYRNVYFLFILFIIRFMIVSYTLKAYNRIKERFYYQSAIIESR